MWQKVRKQWKKEPIAILALFSAILAFGVSVRSCAISEDSLKQSQVQFKQERSLILVATFNSEHPEHLAVNLSPLESSFRLLRGEAFIPRRIYKDIIPVDGFGKFIHMGSVSAALVNFFAKAIPGEKDIAKIVETNLPVILRSYYVTKGEAYTDVSLYMLSMQVFVIEDKRPSITLTNFTFIQRLTGVTERELDELDRIVDDDTGLKVPARKP